MMKTKERKKGKAKWIVLAVVVVIIIAAVAGGGGGDDAAQGDPAVSSAPKEKTSYGVGEAVEQNDVVVTLLGVTENKGTEIFQPEAGNVFVLCELEIANNSSKDVNVSSMLSFEAYIDDYAATVDLSALSSTNTPQLDGTVAAGKKMRGVVGYQVAEGWSNVEIKFTPDFWSGKDITFAYSK